MFLGKNPSFLAEVAKSVGHDFKEKLASMRHQKEAPVVATLGPIFLLVLNFDGCVFPLLRHFPRHPHSHDDAVECEQDFVGTGGKPKRE